MAWDLTGNRNTNPNVNFVGTTDQEPLVIRTQGHEAVRIDASGNVGIGTAAPTSKLEIHAQDGMQIVGYQPFLTLNDSHHPASPLARIQNANGDIGLNPHTFAVRTTGPGAMIIKNGSGNVGMGTDDPTSKLEIIAQDALTMVGYQPFLTLTDNENNLNARARIQNAGGDIKFYTEASFATGILPMIVQNSGDVTMAGNLTVAKDIRLPGADCAEDFDVACSEETEPGTVMIINPEGALEPSREAYDKKVAGVVSGAGDLRPGIVLDQRQVRDSRAPLALVGKVYCKVDACYSPIEVGDLLTTSTTPGHAMKAGDPIKAFGAVIGKALRPCLAGQGLIPILIALQ